MVKKICITKECQIVRAGTTQNANQNTPYHLLPTAHDLSFFRKSKSITHLKSIKLNNFRNFFLIFTRCFASYINNNRHEINT